MTYWQRRLQNPLHKAYNENEQATRQWLSVYQQASKDIKAEIFDTYQKMNVEKPLISDFYRYNNLQKIEMQINDSVLQLGVKEADFTKQSLQHATLVGSQAAADVLNTNVLNKRAIDELIMRPWHDANFSDRIWKNKAQLINSLKSELTNGIIQGKSIYEVANTIDGRLDVGRSQTQRLVRTEYMHALNQGQIESYRAKGYTKLKWIATMDDKTSKICRKRNGKEYDIDHLPDIPAHPNCRCTMVPVINMAAAEKRGDEIRRLKDKISGKMEAEANSPRIHFDKYDENAVYRSDEVMDWVNNVTTSEKNSVGYYTGAGNHSSIKYEGKKYHISSFQWNEYIQTGKVPGFTEGSELENVAKKFLDDHTANLDGALEKGLSPFDMITMRGMSKKEFDTLGTTSQVNSYRSTTLDYNTARQYAGDNKESDGSKYLAEFRIPKNSKGAYVWQYSMYADEQEWLLPRNAKFKKIGDTYIDKDGIYRAVFEILM